jgi:CrcB protein
VIVLGFVVAAGVGTLLRWEASRRVPPPLGTLLVNVAGSFGLGLLHGAGAGTTTVLGVAGLGALTTFSTLAVELTETARRAPQQALTYAGTTLIVGVGAAWLGIVLA